MSTINFVHFCKSQCSTVVRNTVVRATYQSQWETPDFGHP